MYIVNIPSYFFSCYAPFSYASDLNKYRFEQISFFSLLSALFTILFSVAQASVAKKNSKNQDYKIKEIRELCNKNPINHILLESLDKNLLVQVSLKSRKVYIGIIESARFLDLDNYSESVVSIIPYLSGYRDKYNLSLNIECNYMDIYDSKDINFSSKPLSLSQFRYIIPIHEIDSFSLFDVDTYLSFKNTQHK